jgi:hypothetical protein
VGLSTYEYNFDEKLCYTQCQVERRDVDSNYLRAMYEESSDKIIESLSNLVSSSV